MFYERTMRFTCIIKGPAPYLFLPPLIQTQKGVKSQKIAKLHPKSTPESTFFLSRSLPQSSRAKKWRRLFGSQNAVNYSVLWTYHAFYLQKIIDFWPEGQGRKIAKNCFQTSGFLGILSCQNAANTSVFRRFALRAGSNNSEENTGIYDTF